MTTTPVDQLRAAVHQLTRPVRRKIMRDAIGDEPPRTISAMVPSLLDQLDDAAEPGQQTGGGAGSAPGSKPPTGEDVMAARMAIDDGTTSWRRAVGLPRQDDTAAGLRNLAEHLVAAGDEHQVAELADLTHGWVRQALGALDISYAARGLRGVPCPVCGTAWIDGDDGREYALILTFSSGGMVRAAECRQAGCRHVWWRGQALAQLGAYVRSYAAATDTVFVVRPPCWTEPGAIG